jgi:predicted nucleic-acid-binding protein
VDPSQGGLCENPRANVLVRFLVEDDEAQAARAVKLVARAVRQGDQLFVADVVLCETVWVLRAGYEFDRDATQGAALHGAVASPDAKGG